MAPTSRLSTAEQGCSSTYVRKTRRANRCSRRAASHKGTPETISGTYRRFKMNEHRREILDMLATGKITADEADRLLAALNRGESVGAASAASDSSASRPQPKYLRVLVEAEDADDDG